MSFTAVIGARAAAPGNLELGVPLGSIQAHWNGPFNPGNLLIPGVGRQDIVAGVPLAVPPDTAASMARSDSSWYTFTAG